MKKILISLLLAVASIGSASATIITATTNVDNNYSLYISTNDAVLGTLIGSGGAGYYWSTTNTVAATLTANTTNYIHLVATNEGGPGGFLGVFTLSDAAFQFDTGTQTLLTGANYWNQNTTGFGNTYAAAVAEGVKGVSPWGALPAYGTATPTWIWNYVSNNGNDTQTVYFTATINSANNGQQVPEPASLALLGLGLAGLALLRKRRVL